MAPKSAQRLPSVGGVVARALDGGYCAPMGVGFRHARSYHEWPISTPVIDAIRTVIAFASVLIGSYAALFLALALWARDWEAAADTADFFVGIAIANGFIDGVRHWRRHHG